MSSFEEKLAKANADIERYKGKGPTPEEIADAPKMRDWSLVDDHNHLRPYLVGHVYNHPRLGSGIVSTSYVVWISEDKKYARTLSRLYVLED